MTTSLKIGLLFAFLWGISACTPPPDQLGALDLVAWRSDRGSCTDVRSGLVEAFRTEQEQLLGKTANEIGTLLGRPDIHQLGGRNQKYYVYFLEKGVHCDDITKKSTALKAILRFNAVGLLAEITVQTQPIE